MDFVTKSLNEFANNSKYVTVNGNEFKIEFRVRIMFSLCTTFLCVLIYVLSHAFFQTFSKTYGKLDNKAKMFWNLAVVRGIYGTYATIGAIYEIWFDTQLWTHVTEGRTMASYILTINHLGFFLFEVATQCFFDIKFKTFSRELHIHHAFSLSCLLHVVGYDINHFYCNATMLLELSTPFSCMCFLLLKLGMGKTLLWKINQFILVHTFHIRSIIEWSILYDMFVHRKEFMKMPVGLIFSQTLGLLAIAIFLTPYWKHRKTEQLFTQSDWSLQHKDENHHQHKENGTKKD